MISLSPAIRLASSAVGATVCGGAARGACGASSDSAAGDVLDTVAGAAATSGTVGAFAGAGGWLADAAGAGALGSSGLVLAGWVICTESATLLAGFFAGVDATSAGRALRADGAG